MAGHVSGRFSFANSTYLAVIHEFHTITNFSGVFRPWPFDTLTHTIAPTLNSHTHSMPWLSRALINDAPFVGAALLIETNCRPLVQPVCWKGRRA